MAYDPKHKPFWPQPGSYWIVAILSALIAFEFWKIAPTLN